ncbi:hypothetical protein Hanom_Chr17g01581651 [Helianthus anomalus]
MGFYRKPCRKKYRTQPSETAPTPPVLSLSLVLTLPRRRYGRRLSLFFPIYPSSVSLYLLSSFFRMSRCGRDV